MPGELMSVVVATTAPDSEVGPVAALFQLLLLGAIVAGVVVARHKYRAYQAQKQALRDAARVAEVTDLLSSEHDDVRSVTAVTVPLPYVDKKGRRRELWSSRTLALTARHLVIFEPTGSGRTTLDLSDVVTTSTANGRLTVTVSGSGTHQFGVPAGMLAGLEQDIRRLVTANRNGGRVASVADELVKLDELRRQGVIDAGDWERAKDLYLGKSEDARQRAARELRQIYELHRSGVLSASEFNMKKWDILARTN